MELRKAHGRGRDPGENHYMYTITDGSQLVASDMEQFPDIDK